MRQYLSKLPRSTEELLQWHEKFISPLTLIIGFTIDALIFREVDLFASNLILFAHLCIAAIGIVLFHMIQSGYLRGKLFLTLVPFLPSVIQFSFGALFSGFVILYSQSAAYATSWIFVGLLAIFLVGNERFRKLYTQFAFQATIYFAVLISFIVFFLPIVFLRIGTEIFLISEAAAIGIFFVLINAFRFYAPQIVRPARWTLVKSVGSILLIMNVLYFTNAIPPIPLALKEASVAHAVTRAGDEYRLQAEPLLWYQKYLNYNTVFHKAPGERIFVYTAIFAPTKLSTTVLHEWEFYDPVLERWMERNTVSFPIRGGRDGGYRGYTIMQSGEDGAWRVNVRTEDGRLIGRVAFTVVSVSEKAGTEEVVQ
ncbi:MAG: DUF2914 domain-containing protein [Minisyncoccia bacterium]